MRLQALARRRRKTGESLCGGDGDDGDGDGDDAVFGFDSQQPSVPPPLWLVADRPRPVCALRRAPAL